MRVRGGHGRQVAGWIIGVSQASFGSVGGGQSVEAVVLYVVVPLAPVIVARCPGGVYVNVSIAFGIGCFAD